MLRSFLILLLVAAASPTATAQLAFELANPLVVVDGQRAQVEGAPLRQRVFGALLVEAPGWGRLRISGAPFPGARRSGDFDRTRLVIVLGGRSLRLRSSTPLLSTAGPVPAYVRLETDAGVPTSGPIRLGLAGTPDPAASFGPLDAMVSRDDASDRQLDADPTPERPAPATAKPAPRFEPDLPADPLPPSGATAPLRAEIAILTAERDALRAERDALRRDRDRLRDELARGRTAVYEPQSDERTMLSLPSFDLARLDNADEIRARLADMSYPKWAAASRLGGDVLVLFQTDARGTVVRTAVPRPIGGGLDAIAEEIVRAMRFRPVRADGQATRLRSQVVVRFQP